MAYQFITTSGALYTVANGTLTRDAEHDAYGDPIPSGPMRIARITVAPDPGVRAIFHLRGGGRITTTPVITVYGRNTWAGLGELRRRQVLESRPCEATADCECDDHQVGPCPYAGRHSADCQREAAKADAEAIALDRLARRS